MLLLSALPRLSIIIPAFNEARTLPELLTEVQRAAPGAQILLVDDASTDSTYEIMRVWVNDHPEQAELIRHGTNRGKGRAVRSALEQVQGEVVLIQDADLECHPRDYPALIDPMREGLDRVVYGSRFLKPAPGVGWSINRIGVAFLNLLIFLLFGRRLTDHACCYKVFPAELLRSLDLTCERFEFCAEVTAKLCMKRIPIIEVPVSYTPRDCKGGKKLRSRDGLSAAATLFRVRFGVPPLSPNKE